MNVPVVAYADDLTLLLRRPQDEKPFLDFVSFFDSASGLQLNIKKCVGMFLGPHGQLHGHATQVTMAGAQVSVRLLGIQVCSSNNDVHVCQHTLESI